MVFSDLFFLFVFLPLFALLYLLAARRDRHDSLLLDSPQQAYKNHVLILFSLIFYAWGEPVYVFLMLGCVVFNYLIGITIDRSPVPRFFLILGILGNLAVLGTFKYADFIAHTLNAWGIPVSAPGIALPIGISFYTFQSMSYLIDVYRKDAPAQYRFGRLLLYVSMFPQLVAGPIVRYGTVAEEIGNRHISANDFAEGAYRFLIGLAKKVLLANQFSEIVDQFLRGSLHDLTTTGAWIGILAFAFQIYFDFSGYSDMAIGMGRCLGFHFNENFNHPYISRSITEFWRRWHISLGSFFRDYVYIPMGGNRRHQPLNILCVWFLTGLWHGASWNFISVSSSCWRNIPCCVSSVTSPRHCSISTAFSSSSSVGASSTSTISRVSPAFSPSLPATPRASTTLSPPVPSSTISGCGWPPFSSAPQFAVGSLRPFFACRWHNATPAKWCD